MKTVEFGQFTYNAPEKFAELNYTQLIAIAEAVASKKTLADGKIYIASKWFPEAYKQVDKYLLADKKSGMKGDVAAVNKFLETTEDLHALAQLCNWVNSDKKHTTHTWLIPDLTIGGVTYFGPTDKFANIDFWEYCKADTYFSRYQSSGNNNEFAKFLACFYRVANPNKKEVEETGNKRIRFNDNHILKNANPFRQIDPVLRVAITLNYVALKQWLMGVFPEVFRGRTSKSDDNGNSTNQDVGRMYGRLLLNIAKRRHQDEEVIARKPLLLVLEDQNDEMERVREFNDRIKNLK